MPATFLQVPPSNCDGYGACLTGIYISPDRIPQIGDSAKTTAEYVADTSGMKTSPATAFFPQSVLFIPEAPDFGESVPASDLYREQHANPQPDDLLFQAVLNFDFPVDGSVIGVTLSTSMNSAGQQIVAVSRP